MRAVSFLRMSALCAVPPIVLPLCRQWRWPSPARNRSPPPSATASPTSRGQQNPTSGEIADFASFGSDLTVTSLAAAGVNAADVHGVDPGAPSLQDFLLGAYSDEPWHEDPPLGAVTDYERAVQVAYAAGLDPARISAESNLPAQIAGRWNPAAGSFGEPSTNSTVFAILTLTRTPMPDWALAPAVSYLRQGQHDDHGWNYPAAATPLARAKPSDPEMTAAAVAALCEAGVPAYDADVASALGYLQGRLVEATGAIHSDFGDNSDTTAWAVSGLNACGIDPQSAAWTTAANMTPIDHLLSLQIESGPEAGGFGYEDTSEAGLYSTQDALRAIAGAAFVPPAPAREDPSLPSIRPVPSVADGTPVPHVLVVGLGPSNVRICKVIAPAGAALTQVLAAAKAHSDPAGCVTSFSVAGDRVASINGVAPANEDEAWLLRLDRGHEAPAGEQPVGFGDLVSLRLGANPSNDRGPQGEPGSAGPRGRAGDDGGSGSAGKPGPRGRTGASGARGPVGRRASRGTMPRSVARRAIVAVASATCAAASSAAPGGVSQSAEAGGARHRAPPGLPGEPGGRPAAVALRRPYGPAIGSSGPAKRRQGTSPNTLPGPTDLRWRQRL